MPTPTKTTRRPKGTGSLYTVTRQLWNEHSGSFEPTTLYQAAEDIAHPLDPKIYKLYSDGVYVSDLMQMFDAARPTIYKVINEYKAHSS